MRFVEFFAPLAVLAVAAAAPPPHDGKRGAPEMHKPDFVTTTVITTDFFTTVCPVSFFGAISHRTTNL